VPRDIAVAIPARPEFIHVLRAVVASVAARMDFPYDAIEDLRIVVDEACTQLLRVEGSATLRLRITPSSGEILLLASTDARSESWPTTESERTLGWQVIEGLTDQASFARDEGAPALRMSKRLGGAIP
jgi:serine/threonine-protein kinase RsbW